MRMHSSPFLAHSHRVEVVFLDIMGGFLMALGLGFSQCGKDRKSRSFLFRSDLSPEAIMIAVGICAIREDQCPMTP